MRILFIPCVQGVVPHLIPLMALASKLDARRHETAFLLPAAFHKAFKNSGRQVLDINYRRQGAFRDEVLACGRFRPDVVVDDLSATALLTTRVVKKPRVAIKRTGVFPGALPRNSAHEHSMGRGIKSFDAFYEDCEALCGIPVPQNVAEMCDAGMNIIPGIRTVEVLPDALATDPTYVFAGPLIVPDLTTLEMFSAAPSCTDVTDDILRFVARNVNRTIVYLTLGSALKGSQPIYEVLRFMLDLGVAVISNVPLPEIDSSLHERFCYSRFLPMHTICANVDLMIHHCGSGTYQYQILHAVPAICIGSGCYDRDDVAMRLQELGTARYIPFSDEEQQSVSMFRTLFEECADTAGSWHRDAKQALHTLRVESERTSASFDFEAVLEQSMSTAAA